MRLACELGDSVRTLPSPEQVGITQSVEDLNRTKSEGREEPVFACLNWDNSLLLSLDLDLHHQLPGFQGTWTKSTPPDFLGLQLVDGESWEFSVSLII